MRDTFEAIEARVHAWECYDPERLSLPGLKVGIKDIINTADFPTRRGSPIYKSYTPGNDARIVSKLRQAGCVIVGKTTTSEFGVHHLYADTKNPHDFTRTPGTSSAGSAVAVATGQVPVAIGTQTGGSVIRPASYCGVWAFKPSFGLIPRTGILKTADTLDTVGIFADTPGRLRQVLDILRVSGKDYASEQQLERNRSEEIYAHGATVPDGHPLIEEALEVHRKIYHKSLSYYFRKEVEQFPDLISDMFKEQVEEGNRITPTEYRQLLERQQCLGPKIEAEIFGEAKFLILHKGCGVAPVDESKRDPDTCAVWTLLGLPVINVPYNQVDGLPCGTQIVARKYWDYPLLDYAVSFGMAHVDGSRPYPDIRALMWGGERIIGGRSPVERLYGERNGSNV